MKVEVRPSLAPVPNKPTVSVDVKQHSNNKIYHTHAAQFGSGSKIRTEEVVGIAYNRQ